MTVFPRCDQSSLKVVMYLLSLAALPFGSSAMTHLGHIHKYRVTGDKGVESRNNEDNAASLQIFPSRNSPLPLLSGLLCCAVMTSTLRITQQSLVVHLSLSNIYLMQTARNYLHWNVWG
ncbi:hypothetical protein GGR50DRAFT_643627 [Xylaria sp. CBS 124048]|nr:hypothetical protein GGR50DRAFT_643627 [Xylaria sp. CBS 124048]